MEVEYTEDLIIYEKAEHAVMEGDDLITEYAVIEGDHLTTEHAVIEGDHLTTEHAVIEGDHLTTEHAVIEGDHLTTEHAVIEGDHLTTEHAVIEGDHLTTEHAVMEGDDLITEHAVIEGDHLTTEHAVIEGDHLTTEHAVIEGDHLTTEHAVIKGDDLTIRCEFQSKFKIKSTTWLFNGKYLDINSKDDKYTSSLDKNSSSLSLTIHNLKSKDSGTYECVLTNIVRLNNTFVDKTVNFIAGLHRRLNCVKVIQYFPACTENKRVTIKVHCKYLFICFNVSFHTYL